MVKFDFSLSKEYFRDVLFHNVGYWIGQAVRVLYLAFIAYYFYILWFFGLWGKMAKSVWFYLILLVVVWTVTRLINSIPTVNVRRCKRKKIRVSYVISDEEIKYDFFNGKMDSSHSFPFGSVKKAEEKDKYFTILYVSGRRKEYLLKSDITEGSAEELRQIFSDNLGDKFKNLYS